MVRVTASHQDAMGGIAIYKSAANSVILFILYINIEILPRKQRKRTWNSRWNRLKARVASKWTLATILMGYYPIWAPVRRLCILPQVDIPIAGAELFSIMGKRAGTTIERSWRTPIGQQRNHTVIDRWPKCRRNWSMTVIAKLLPGRRV